MKAGRLERYLMDVWYGTRPGYWLRPLGQLYGWLVRLRGWLYARGVLRTQQALVPVIVVGNLTVGGTGKTPLVLHLVALLRSAGYRPGIVSRGYGGSVRDAAARLVKAHSDPLLVGDEPVLLARRAACPVAVCAKRARAVSAVVDAGVDVVISDDGLQHLALARDAQILVLDGVRRMGNQRCLPAGPLRAPLGDPDQYDLLIVNGGRDEDPMRMQLVAADALRLSDGNRRALSAFAGQRVHAVAAIGRPERFFATLRDAGIEVIGHPHRDHSMLSRQSLTFPDDLPVFITEKDAVKCDIRAGSNCWVVPVDARLNPAADTALAELLARVMTKTHKR